MCMCDRLTVCKMFRVDVSCRCFGSDNVNDLHLNLNQHVLSKCFSIEPSEKRKWLGSVMFSSVDG